MNARSPKDSSRNEAWHYVFNDVERNGCNRRTMWFGLVTHRFTNMSVGQTAS
jgi:hypothetical protein